MPVVNAWLLLSDLAAVNHLFLQLSVDYERAVAGKQEQDAELRELRQNKELLTQWERQIADIIQWVTEEKDARAYLKSVAKKLADDVDNLKTSAGSMGLGRVSGSDRQGMRAWGGGGGGNRDIGCGALVVLGHDTLGIGVGVTEH